MSVTICMIVIIIFDVRITLKSPSQIFDRYESIIFNNIENIAERKSLHGKLIAFVERKTMHLIKPLNKELYKGRLRTND